MDPVRLVLFTRFPEAGRAKTRLIPRIGANGAAELHRRLTERTVAVARATKLSLELRTTGAKPEAFLDWLGHDLTTVDQGDGDLGARMQRATNPAPVLFIGTDAPDLIPEHLTAAAALLQQREVVLGPAEDGGYWALGLATPHAFLFDNMPWGTKMVFSETIARLSGVNVSPGMLPLLADLDRPEDLDRWPEMLR